MGCSNSQIIKNDKLISNKCQNENLNLLVYNKSKQNNVVNNEIIIDDKNNNQNKIIKVNKDKATLKTKNKLFFNSDPISKHYTILEKIGSGSFGKVFLCQHKVIKKLRAVKVVNKSVLAYQDDEKCFLKEIELLSSINHPNIINIYEFFEDDQNYYVIEEYAEGGELYDYLYQLDNFDESITSKIIKQLLSSICYLHDINIVHRDLKPENILLESKSKDPKNLNIKIIDFGAANYYSNTVKLTLKIGTPYYIAPEVVNKNYNKECDLWSCGIIMYTLLCGYPPFDGKSNEEIMNNIVLNEVIYNKDDWQDISINAKNLLSKLLLKDPNKRISAKEALSHNWFVFDNKNEDFVKESNFKKHLQNFCDFARKEKLQHACINFLINQVASKEMKNDLKKTFLMLDKSGDGRLDYEEIYNGFTAMHKYFSEFEKDDVMNLIKNIDLDCNGYIEYEEFISATVNKKNLINKENLKIAFDFFDSNKSGTLDINEIKEVLNLLNKKEGKNSEVNKVMSEIDINNDGEINFEEFALLMKNMINA